MYEGGQVWGVSPILLLLVRIFLFSLLLTFYQTAHYELCLGCSMLSVGSSGCFSLSRRFFSLLKAFFVTVFSDAYSVSGGFLLFVYVYVPGRAVDAARVVVTVAARFSTSAMAFASVGFGGPTVRDAGITVLVLIFGVLLSG